jgi:carboxypeptidase family protein
MRITATLLAILAAALVLSGQVVPRPRNAPVPTPPTDAPPSTKPGTVDGVVTNSVTGEPVKKAIVTLRNNRQNFSYQALTDAAGQFHFDNVDPGTYAVAAGRDGFVYQPPGARLSYAVPPVSVAEEQHVRDVAVKLVPFATISGHIVDEDGDPIPNASVRAMRYVYQQGARQLLPQSFTTSNDLGEYELPDVAAGRFRLMVMPSSRVSLPARTRTAHAHEGYAVTYYPNASDLAQASAIETTPGAHVANIDFHLRKCPVFHIRGKIADSQTGQASRNLMIRVGPEGDLNFWSQFAIVFRQPDGAFDVANLASGHYAVIAMLQDANVAAMARASVQISDQDVDVGTLTLSPGFDISGRITVDGPQPNHIPAQLSLQNVNVFIGSPHNATADSGGVFQIHNVMPDIYSLNVFGVAVGMYVKSIRLGDQDVLSGQLDLRGGNAPLNIVFGTDGGQVQGSVQDQNGMPAQGVTVTLVPLGEYENRRDRSKVSRTSPGGTFTLKDVAPGDYRVFAWGDVDQNLVQTPEFRKAFESRAVAVTVGSNSKESVTLKLISSDDVEWERSKLP